MMSLRPVLTGAVSALLRTACHRAPKILEAITMCRGRKCQVIRRRTTTGPRHPCATKIDQNLADGWIPDRVPTLLGPTRTGPKPAVHMKVHLVPRMLVHMRAHLAARMLLGARENLVPKTAGAMITTESRTS